jgi:hypothetical protein
MADALSVYFQLSSGIYNFFNGACAANARDLHEELP